MVSGSWEASLGLLVRRMSLSEEECGSWEASLGLLVSRMSLPEEECG